MQVKAIASVVAGCSCIVFSFSPAVQDHAERIFGASDENRKTTARLVRVVGSFVGVLFLLIGFTYFLDGH